MGDWEIWQWNGDGRMEPWSYVQKKENLARNMRSGFDDKTLELYPCTWGTGPDEKSQPTKIRPRATHIL